MSKDPPVLVSLNIPRRGDSLQSKSHGEALGLGGWSTTTLTISTPSLGITPRPSCDFILDQSFLSKRK